MVTVPCCLFYRLLRWKRCVESKSKVGSDSSDRVLVSKISGQPFMGSVTEVEGRDSAVYECLTCQDANGQRRRGYDRYERKEPYERSGNRCWKSRPPHIKVGERYQRVFDGKQSVNAFDRNPCFIAPYRVPN